MFRSKTLRLSSLFCFSSCCTRSFSFCDVRKVQQRQRPRCVRQRQRRVRWTSVGSVHEVSCGNATPLTTTAAACGDCDQRKMCRTVRHLHVCVQIADKSSPTTVEGETTSNRNDDQQHNITHACERGARAAQLVRASKCSASKQVFSVRP